MGSSSLSLSLSLSLCGALTAQVPSLVTYDHKEPATVPVVGSTPLNEVWADCKSAGDGRTYSVGTIQVHDARESDSSFLPLTPSFSGARAITPTPLLPVVNPVQLPLPDRARVQIVVLQAARADGTILWQRYFNGDSLLGTFHHLSNAARAVSVWPVLDANGVLDDAASRIAICGESYDGHWGLGFARTFAPFSDTSSAGFVAVFDGFGSLKWVQLFFFDAAGSIGPHPGSNCSITDVSMRVESVGGVLTDVVTYCGVSTTGALGVQVGLTPVLPFAAPGAPGGPQAMCLTPVGVPAGGSSHNGDPNFPQWDGIVGRLTRSQAPGAVTNQVFHSVVGGMSDDALWGIAEIDANRFVAVGSTRWLGPAQTGDLFPFTLHPVNTACLYDATVRSFHVGAVLLFDASATRNNGALELVLAHPLGTANMVGLPLEQDRFTCARDVAVSVSHVPDLLNPGVRTIDETIRVVGSTDDPDLLLDAIGQGGPFTGFQPLLNGTGALPGIMNHTDGFLVSGHYEPLRAQVPPIPPGVIFTGGSFRGGQYDDGIIGVAAWNEHPDHVYVAGFASDYPRVQGAVQQGCDMDVAAVYIASDQLPPSVVANHTLLRSARFGAQGANPGSATAPSALGFVLPSLLPVAMRSALQSFDMGPLGPVASGGLCADSRGRVTAVGACNGSSAATTVAPFMVGRTSYGGWEALRVEVDMLPPRVSRTDGTGSRVGPNPPGLIPVVAAASAGLGGTTPMCALDPFGRRPGVSVPALERILIDCEVPPPSPSQNVTLLVDRPTYDGTLVGGLFHLGFPSSPPLIYGGAELWILNQPLLYLFAPTPGRSLRWVLTGIPQPSFQFSVQFVCMLSSPLACGLDMAASPAITFDF